MDNPVNYADKLQQLGRVFPVPVVSGSLRTKPEDFKVVEELNFSPSGSGEHLFIRIKKTNANTQWVVNQLGKIFELSSQQIGYAGKKDRHSVSTQWFSLHLPGQEVDLNRMVIDGVELIESVRHNKKLKIGSLKCNQFEIILRDVSGKIDSDIIRKIIKSGVPNYFGSQRFGHNASNLELADDYLAQKTKIKNRVKRGMVISSARSYLFNLILSERVKQKNWNEPLGGDCLNLNGSQSFFCIANAKAENENDQSLDKTSMLSNIKSRIVNGDLHISGLLAGREKSESAESAKLIEDEVLAQYSNWMQAFHRLNLSTARRSFRVIPKDFCVEHESDTIKLNFKLNKGSYATSVIRELVNVKDVSIREKQ